MKHVLFVDDEILTHRLIKIFLRKQADSGSLQLHFAKSVASAKNLLASNEGKAISLIFTDINMPEEDGFELLAFVKGEYKDKRVYIVTGYDSLEYQDKARALGCDGYLTKPINLPKLRELIG